LSKKIAAIILTTSIIFGSVLVPNVVFAASSDKEYEAQNLLDQALSEKSFYKYNTAYNAIVQVDNENSKNVMMAKLASLQDVVWTEDIKKYVALLGELTKTASGEVYDEVVNQVVNTNLQEIDKQYLLGEVSSWGKKLVYTDDYVKAVNEVNSAWGNKNSIGQAKKAVASVKNNYSRTYLEKQIYSIENGTENGFVSTEEASAKKKFAELLQDKQWLSQNTKYKKQGDIQFTTLDINQDGTPEMLLYYGEGSMADKTLYVVTYNNGDINVQAINTSHGGYAGYLSDEKVILTSGMTQGYVYGSAYKLQDGQYKQVYSWSDNRGNVWYNDDGSLAEGSKNLKCEINNSEVSKEEYDKFQEKIVDAVKNSKEFYEINYSNIQKYLMN
jgi:hypothetical protein